VAAPAGINSKDFVATPLSLASGNAVVADIHLHSRDYREQAVTEFQDILKSDPNNATACRGLGYAYLQKQDFKRAAEYFKRASQLDSQDPRVHYYNALLMVRESGFASSANLPAMTTELETSIRLDPKFADSYALLAFAQSTAGNPAEAIGTMRKAIAISPRNESYLFNLANLYQANRQPDQAITVLQSLQGSSDPQIAARAAGMLAQVQEFQEVTQARDGSIGRGLVIRSQPQEEETVETPSHAPAPAAGPAKFIKGVLAKVDCSTPPLATLTVASGAKTWKMHVADRNHVILIGADAFSCDWNKQKVALNYRETSEGEGNVVSLEIQ
jgi:Flp pilus assembly protein TadD